MRVKFLLNSASAAGAFRVGQEADVSDEDGDLLVSSGVAEPVDFDAAPLEPVRSEPETATVEPDEEAVIPAPKRRRATRV